MTTPVEDLQTFIGQLVEIRRKVLREALDVAESGGTDDDWGAEFRETQQLVELATRALDQEQEIAKRDPENLQIFF